MPLAAEVGRTLAMHLKHARITSLHMHVAFLKIFFLFYKGDSDLNEIFI